ncbi:MAG: hypothetical protein A2571_00440 [Candidatus Vogelbacteria bacterium RIFOXYD1_FULL_44_32]|uniref:DUF5667 domain-containing protein n=1 Tax=Candidatus Vogelbacteria bacterium RIFOXYD1_FULL_44_32 TaxID=1802438 RepID=A0A1G2QE21_9BACT|nr:MAG: hypothetical protein A2571_00440 [Candidatus Vogelbacteria bacterium RIFOXYD1_FULL_44_32]
MKSNIFKIAIFLAVFAFGTPALAQSGHLATIQDQARANRESFLRLQKEPQTPVPGNATSTEARLNSLDGRVSEIREQTILINYNRIIAKLGVYTSYLDNVNERLEDKVLENETAGFDVTTAAAYVASANLSLETASSTIATARASSTEVFLSANPSGELIIMKERLVNTSLLIQKAREAIVAGINSLKTETK